MAQASSKAGKQKAGASKRKGNGPARKSAGANGPSAEERYLMVQEAAYYHAQQAGFNGDSVEHWLAAEKEIEQRLNGG